MIATESAAEGLNLQFCSMLINYDLPWNPQRVEQRIGRLHRYGQKHDVVVINLLNKENIADRRVFELLSYKFQLFEGVFGASDTILGIVEGVDFEKRIASIYDTCRTTEQIENAFTELRQELDEKINSHMKDTKQKLLENLDEDVAARMKVNLHNSESYLTKFETMLWLLTKHVLDGKYAEFDGENRHFKVTKTPYYDSKHGYKRHGGLELTATPQVETSKGAVKFKNVVYECRITQNSKRTRL